MIVGTAGHIDHGKTSLVKRLTGRDTDRLPEEIKRGISIELGYAYVALADGGVLGFVDVPGHEKFVHTMVAGATGIDCALLVIAADDGVMPQTDEHLDILELLAVRAGAIVLNKIDAVDAARIVQVRAQVASRVRDTVAHAWPVFPLSAHTGEGVPALQAHLLAQAAAPGQREAGGGFRLAIDRVFTLAGVGTIVTGTAHAGRVHVGDELALVPGGLRARVRSIHAQDRPATEGMAGQRIALNLAGVEKSEVERGQWVQAGALANVGDRFDASVRLSARELRALPELAGLHLHHGTADVLARVSALDGARLGPGETRLVAVRTARPLALCRGDRFVLRDPQARATLGGGVVLDIAPPARGRRAAARLQVLQAIRDRPAAAALALWLDRESVALARVRSGWNLDETATREMMHAAGARIAAGTGFAASAWAGLREKLGAAVAATHEREPEMPGVEQNRLRRMVAPALDAETFGELVDELLAEGRLVRRGAFLGDPAHKAELGRNERVMWERIKPLLLETPFEPPRVRDIARELKIAEAEVRTLLRRVARIGEIALVAPDHFFDTAAVRAMADIAAELGRHHGAARAAEFRDRIGTGRKVAIQILEFFDRVGYTRRVRDDHLVRRANPWRTGSGADLPRA
ncbi:MAG TPA: selenocysteine-specific translation elongation factor [Burkholderiaceae bacterium]|nr:selenocysteine-specific translation elongation factor [Burkholderiaceae bacterium]